MGLSQSFVSLVREQNEDYIISLIEQKKVDIFARDDEERTALHWASAEGKKKIASVLIDQGVPVNSVDKHKYTPLHTAVFRNQEESAKLLIQRGIDINLQDEAGMTALHWAVYEHNYSCMQLLLRKGARLDIKNEKGQTVWDIARGLKKAHRNRVLEALQASSSVNEQGSTLLSNWNSLTTKEIYLSSLCQLWGAIKFIHPYVAYREDVDWDLALVETLPKILNNTNLSPQDFKVVIVDMLKKLKDPNTIVANLEPSVQKLVQTPKPNKKQITSEQTPTKTDGQSAEQLASSADRSSPIIPRANKAARQESRDSLPTDGNDSASSTSEPTTTPATPEPSRKPTSQPYVAVMSDNTGVVVTTDYNQFNDPQRYNALLHSIYTALNNCASVIFDVRCRSAEPLKSSSALALSIMYYEAFKLFLEEDLFLPTYRHRTFHGYPEHRRGYSHMFHHGFMITDCEVLRPDANQRQQFLQGLQTPATPVKTGSASVPGTPLANSGSNPNLLASTDVPASPMTPDRRQVNIGTPKGQRNTPAATPTKLLPPGPQLPSLNKPIVFIIDQETPQGIVDIALALKSRFKAGIVYHAVPDDCYIDEVTSEMYLHEPGIAISVINLPPSLKVFVRQNEKVNPDGTIGLRPDVVIKQEKRPFHDKDEANDAAMAEALKLTVEKSTKSSGASPSGAVAAIFPKRKLDEEYKTMLFPNVEYRYLALFKLWNIVHYFYPYKDLLEKPWDQVLVEAMPKFEACTTPLDYALAITEVVNNMHDTHAYVRNSVLSTFTGTHVPPVKLRTIGNHTVVVQVEQLGLNDEPKEVLQVGDLILEIDGEPVAAKRAKLENLISASSPAAKVWRVDTKLLSGALGSVAKLKVQREVVSESGVKSDITLDVEVPRVIQAQQLQPLRQGPTFGLLDKLDDSGKQIGYIDLSRIQFNEVDPAMDALLHTNSLIIDLRGYIKGTIYKLAPRLVNRKVAVSRTITPILSSSLLVDDLQSGSVVNQQYCTPATFNLNLQNGSTSDANSAPHYQGKIVALVDIETISHGEHSCLWLKACRPDCYFIGKPTSGTVGNITNLVLPGGVAVGFTSMGVQDRDGSQVQRVGIKPDLFVEETVESIKLNRDVILEAGIGHFQTKDPNQIAHE